MYICVYKYMRLCIYNMYMCGKTHSTCDGLQVNSLFISSGFDNEKCAKRAPKLAPQPYLSSCSFHFFRKGETNEQL